MKEDRGRPIPTWYIILQPMNLSPRLLKPVTKSYKAVAHIFTEFAVAQKGLQTHFFNFTSRGTENKDKSLI